MIFPQVNPSYNKYACKLSNIGSINVLIKANEFKLDLKYMTFYFSDFNTCDNFNTLKWKLHVKLPVNDRVHLVFSVWKQPLQSWKP